MLVSWLVNCHLEKSRKKMDKDKDGQDIEKRKNGVDERIEQKLTDTYNKMDCVATVDGYNILLGEYSIQLTKSNNCKLVMKLGQNTYTCR